MNEILNRATISGGYKEQLNAVDDSISSTLISLMSILPSGQFEELTRKLKPMVLSNGLPGTFCFHVTDITVENGEYIFHFKHPIDIDSEQRLLTFLPTETKLSIMEVLESIL